MKKRMNKKEEGRLFIKEQRACRGQAGLKKILSVWVAGLILALQLTEANGLMTVCAETVSEQTCAESASEQDFFTQLRMERLRGRTGGMLLPEAIIDEQPKPESLSAGVSENAAASVPESVSENAAAVSLSENTLSAETASYAIKADLIDQIRKQLVARKTSFTVVASGLGTMTSGKATKLIYDAVEHTEDGKPEEGDYLLWHLRQWQTWCTPLGNGAYAIRYKVVYLSNAAQEKYVGTEVEKIVKELDLLSTDKSDYEKVRTLYDYLIQRLDYDYAHYRSDPTYLPMYAAYSGLQSGKTVCQGYASLTYRILRRVGIPVRMIAGKGMSENHGWDIVKLGDSYYNIDPTWDDEGKASSYTYFMKNMGEFENHTRFPEYDTPAFHKSYAMTKYSLSFTEHCYSYGSQLCSFENIKAEFTDFDGRAFDTTADKNLRLFVFLNPEKDSYKKMCESLKEDADVRLYCRVVMFDICQNYSKYQTTTDKMTIQLRNYFKQKLTATYITSTPQTMELKNRYEKLVGAAVTDEGAFVLVDKNNRVRYYGTPDREISGLDEAVAYINTETASLEQPKKIVGTSAVQTANDKVRLSWNAVDGADTYLVYREDPSSDFVCLGTVTSNSCTNRVAVSKTYVYKVLALQNEKLIAKSDAFSVSTKKIYLAKGTKVKAGGNVYKVLSSKSGSKTLAYAGAVSKKEKNIVIPDSVTIDGHSYQVTEIASGACKKNKKIKTLIIGKNVTKIAGSAFDGCKSLNAVRIRASKLKKVGKKAFCNISKSAVVGVPAAKASSYGKLLKKAGLPKTAKILK